jgi:hypothetical protein
MAKLMKAQRKAHAEAKAILTKDRLTEDERGFVFRNWHEGANSISGAAGAFFTPYDLAGDFALDGAAGRVIDLCAGIGVLSYFIGERAREALTQGLPASRSTRNIAKLAANSCRMHVGSMRMCLIGENWI